MLLNIKLVNNQASGGHNSSASVRKVGGAYRMIFGPERSQSSKRYAKCKVSTISCLDSRGHSVIGYSNLFLLNLLCYLAISAVVSSTQTGSVQDFCSSPVFTSKSNVSRGKKIKGVIHMWFERKFFVIPGTYRKIRQDCYFFVDYAVILCFSLFWGVGAWSMIEIGRGKTSFSDLKIRFDRNSCSEFGERQAASRK